jgi:hypothetical protein
MHAGTIVSHHYLAHARTVAQSFLRHNPGARFTALVVGEGAPLGDEPFEVVSEHELGLSDIEHRRSIYDDFEYAVSFKPSLLRKLLESDDTVVYLDSDLYILDALTPLAEPLAAHEVLITPHLTRMLPDDGLQPNNSSILNAGAYNTGVVAVRRGATADAFIRWWFDRLVNDCKVAVRRGIFVDQKWMDVVHGVVPGVGLLREPGWNLGHWNMPGLEVGRDGDRWTVDGDPLRVMHFSGFMPTAPARLSKSQNRIDVKPGTPLADLCHEYAEAMLSNGFADVAGGGKNTYFGRRLDQRVLAVRRVAADLMRRR